MSSVFASRPKVCYLPTRGRGEFVKLLFEYANEPYDYVQVQSADLHDSGKFPFAVVPVLEEGDFKLSQTGTIVRYLAPRLGLVPSDPHSSAYVSQFLDASLDLQTRFGDLTVYNLINEKTFLDTVHNIYKGMESLLEKTPRRFLTSNENQITYGDLAIYTITDLIETKYEGALKDYPRLKSLHDRVAMLPRIREYVESERCPQPKLKIDERHSSGGMGTGVSGCACTKTGQCECNYPCRCGRGECGCMKMGGKCAGQCQCKEGDSECKCNEGGGKCLCTKKDK